MNSDRNQLMKRLQTANFCMYDTALFLDTHPDDKQALDAYHKYRDTALILEKEYTAKYGPLTIGSAATQNGWTWADLPWPWEQEG